MRGRVIFNEPHFAFGHAEGISWVLWRDAMDIEALEAISSEVEVLEREFPTTLGSMTVLMPNVGMPSREVMDKIRTSTDGTGSLTYPAGMSVTLVGGSLWHSTWRMIGRTAGAMLRSRMAFRMADDIDDACAWHCERIAEDPGAPSATDLRGLVDQAGLEWPQGHA